jgi:hypothetical protein
MVFGELLALLVNTTEPVYFWSKVGENVRPMVHDAPGARDLAEDRTQVPAVAPVVIANGPVITGGASVNLSGTPLGLKTTR